MNKKGVAAAAIYIAVAVLVLMFAQSMGWIGKQPVQQVNVQTPTQTSTGVIKACTNPSVTMTVGPMKAWQQPGSSLSSEQARLWIDGVDQGNFTDSATKTVSADNKIELIYGYQSSGNANAGYYADYASFTAPCESFLTSSKDGGAYQLVENTDKSNITWNIFNSDTGNKNQNITKTGGDNETIGNGQDGSWTVKFSTGQYKGYSPIRYGEDAKSSKIIFLVEVNGSAYDASKITLAGKNPDGPGKPNFYTLANTDSEVRTFLVPGCPDVKGNLASCEADLGTLKVTKKTAANSDPNLGVSFAVGPGAVRVCAIDQNYDTHTTTGKKLFGIEDDVGAKIGFFQSDVDCVNLMTTV